MVSEFLAAQRIRFIKQVESKLIPQPEAVTTVALIDILDLLERQINGEEETD